MSTRCRAVVAEDEPVLRAELVELLGRLWPELEICGEAADGSEAAEAVERHHPDVLFLDIEMPGMTGLDVARCASGRCHVVFVTAHGHYAVDAFEHGAVDYVLKPFTPARLSAALQRVRSRLIDPPLRLDALVSALDAARAASRTYLRWITVQHGDELQLITLESICYFQADNKYTRVVLPEREALIRWPIRALVDEVDPGTFWQIHRGTLVNVNAVSGVERDIRGNLRVRLKDRHERLPVSTPYVHRFNLV